MILHVRPNTERTNFITKNLRGYSSTRDSWLFMGTSAFCVRGWVRGRGRVRVFCNMLVLIISAARVLPAGILRKSHVDVHLLGHLLGHLPVISLYLFSFSLGTPCLHFSVNSFGVSVDLFNPPVLSLSSSPFPCAFEELGKRANFISPNRNDRRYSAFSFSF